MTNITNYGIILHLLEVPEERKKDIVSKVNAQKERSFSKSRRYFGL